MNKQPILFEPKHYQINAMKAIEEQLKNGTLGEIYPRRMGSRGYMGVDFAMGKDRTVVTHAKINGRGEITKIYFDEYGFWPSYKWYRNPIKWWNWRRLEKRLLTKEFRAKYLGGKK